MRRVILRLIFLSALCSCGTAHAFCYEEAGAMYRIAPRLLWTISKGESNFNPAAVNYNSNGSYDFIHAKTGAGGHAHGSEAPGDPVAVFVQLAKSALAIASLARAVVA